MTVESVPLISPRQREVVFVLAAFLPIKHGCKGQDRRVAPLIKENFSFLAIDAKGLATAPRVNHGRPYRLNSLFAGLAAHSLLYKVWAKIKEHLLVLKE